MGRTGVTEEQLEPVVREVVYAVYHTTVCRSNRHLNAVKRWFRREAQMAVADMPLPTDYNDLRDQVGAWRWCDVTSCV
jgi:hypothetical protein